MVKVLAMFILGYLAGCFQTAYLLGKYKKHIDIRQYGSGNSGTTNALRVMGLKLGLLTFIGDFLKAFLAVLLVLILTKDFFLGVVIGCGVIIGHDFPFFLKFKGGKGIASTMGMVFAIDYKVGLILVAIMLAVVFLTKYVSLASILMCIGLGLYFFISLYHLDLNAGILFVGIGLLGLFQHRSNIKRLIDGSENQLGQKKKDGKSGPYA